MKKLLILLCVPVATLFGSCLKDTGNYDYSDVNVVKIDIPEYSLAKLELQDFRIEPTITQTLAADNSNLRYEWLYSDVNFSVAAMSEEPVSTDSYVTLKIDPATTNKYVHYYRLKVTDINTNVTYVANAGIRIVKPYEGSWAVLHDQGGAKLGTVEFLEDGTTPVTHDIFARYGKEPLSGNPVALGIYTMASVLWAPYYTPPTPSWSNSLFFVITDDLNSSANYCQWRDFDKTRTIADMPQDKGLITSAKLAKTSLFFASDVSFSAIFDGTLYTGRNGFKMYESMTLDGDASLEKTPYFSLGAKTGRETVLYDRENRHLMVYQNSGNTNPPSAAGVFSYTPTNYHAGNEAKAKIWDMNRPKHPENDLNPIPADREVVYIGPGQNGTTSLQNTKPIAVAVGSGSNDMMYVYQFRANKDLFKAEPTMDVDGEKKNIIYTFKKPVGVSASAQFASCSHLENRLYYTSGAMVYLLNYTTGVATPIYDHGRGTIKKMVFARNDINDTVVPDYKVYGKPQYTIGLLVETGANSSELVVLRLSETSGMLGGDGEWNDAQVFDGFGRGVDIVFL